ncbi:hypothetical protein D3C78_1483070 [compost metagenome]
MEGVHPNSVSFRAAAPDGRHPSVHRRGLVGGDLVLKQNYSFTDASRSLGVGESALRRWVGQLQQGRTGVTPQSKSLTPEQQKIEEWEARVARLERE